METTFDLKLRPQDFQINKLITTCDNLFLLTSQFVILKDLLLNPYGILNEGGFYCYKRLSRKRDI